MPANLFKIPRFLKAKDPEALSKAMLQNNISKQTEFEYYSILFVKDTWYAWYYEDIEREVRNGQRS